jgi:HEAT repeat protein
VNKNSHSTRPGKPLSPESRAAATRIFTAKIKGDVPHLVFALRDPDHRAIAAEYLADLGARDAIPQIAVLLDAESNWARGAAIDALGRLGGEAYVARLLALARTDPWQHNRARAIVSLGRLRYDGAFDDVIPFLASPDFNVRRCAALALGELGDKRALVPLAEAKRRERLWRRARYRTAIRKIERID